MRRNWQDAETLTVPVFVPCCPECGGTELIRWGGGENGDNSSTERVICGVCHLHFKITRERFLAKENIYWTPGE